MATSYTGVLTGDRIEWTGGAKPPDGPVRVEVTVLAEPDPDDEYRRVVGAALADLAARGTLDPAAWERWRDACDPLPEDRP